MNYKELKGVKDFLSMESEHENKAIDVVWNRFCTTGHIGNYLLYRRLTEETNGEGARDSNRKHEFP